MDISDVSLLLNDEVPMRDLERAYMEYLLYKYDGNKTKVSKILGISIRGMRNKINEFDLDQYRGSIGRSNYRVTLQ